MKSKIAWIIAAVAFCFGVIFVSAGVLMGGSTHASINTGFFTGDREEGASFISFYDPSEVADVGEIELDDVKSIAFTGDMAKINIIKSDKSYIKHNDQSLKVSLKEDGTLELSSESNKKGYISIGFFTGFSPENTRIDIYVANDLEFIDIQTNMGDVEISDLVIKDFYSTSNLGNIELSNCEINNAEIHMDLGNLEMNDCNIIEIGDFSSNMGNIEMKLVGARGDYIIDTSVNLGKSDIDSGDAAETGKEKAFINVTANLGNIEIDFTK